MDNPGKPNFYGSSAGENSREDIRQSPRGGSSNSNSYKSTVEAVLQQVDEDQTYYQIDVSKLTGKEPHQAIQEASMVSNYVDLEKAERKRKIDKAYRERCKKKKDQMIQGMASLSKENKDLKIENQSFKEKNAFMNQRLQSQTEELNQHKIRLDNLKFEQRKQTTLLQFNPHLCLENKKLKDENAQLRETVKLSNGPLKLVEENGKLRLENLLLKVKIDALCGKILDENSKNSGHK